MRYILSYRTLWEAPLRKSFFFLDLMRCLRTPEVWVLVSCVWSFPANADGARAVSADTFLSSLGINTHIDQGVSGGSYINLLRYIGVRNIRDGGRNVRQTGLVHRETDVRLDLIVEGDLDSAIATGTGLAKDNALMAFEGPNEPNNFLITYNGQQGGGTGSWVPVAQLQAALYQAVKASPALNGYPVFSVSEAGAETENVGLQYLTIPSGAGAILPDATKFADYANTHNYVSGNSNIYVDNQAWNAADPTLKGPWDGMQGEYGTTWRRHYKGYSDEQLSILPRVTTETGWDSVSNIGGERTQGIVLVNNYLAQFKRGWRYTFIYQLRDGEGGGGNQSVFHANSTPKLAATYLHNLTSILADNTPMTSTGYLNYSIASQPATVHDLLLEKGNGTFDLVVWDENVKGADKVTIDLGRSFSKVNIYDVTMGVSPTVSLSGIDSISLSLSDHALIVELAD